MTSARMDAEVIFLVHCFHHLAAAAGDDLSGFHVQQLVADGAVDIAFGFRPDYGGEGAFQFVFHV